MDLVCKIGEIPQNICKEQEIEKILQQLGLLSRLDGSLACTLWIPNATGLGQFPFC